MAVSVCNALLLVMVGVATARAVSAPSFAVLPQDFVAIVGQTASFHCSASGHRPLNYWWTKSSQIIKSDSRVVSHNNGTLQFVAVVAGDAAVYRCFANSSVGSVASVEASLALASLGDFSSIANPVVAASTGSYAVLPCNAPPSVPEASIYWTRNGLSIDFDSSTRQMFTLDGDLVISPINSGSAAAYQCVVENKLLKKKKPVSYFLTVSGTSVTQTPNVLYEPADTEVVVGSNAVFQCIVVDKFIQAVQWKKDGSSSLSRPRVSTAENGRKLRIANAGKADEGVYTCVYGLMTKSAKLTVLVPPVIHNGLQDVMMTVGGNVVLVCNTSGVPSPNVNWRRNGVLFTGMTSRVGSAHMLTLTDVRESDSGAYQCFSSNKAGSVLASAAVVVQSFSPSFTTDCLLQSTVIAFQASQLTLCCTAAASPPPTYSWLFHGQSLVQNSHLRILQTGSLVIQNVKVSTGGKYTCIATNKKGSINQSTVVKVYSQTIIKDNVKKVYGRVGEPASLSCEVQYDNRVFVTVQWTRLGNLVGSMSTKYAVTGHTLVISNVTVADGGEYRCDVRTRITARGQYVNVIHRIIELAVQERPSPPVSVKVFNVESTAAAVEWHAPLFQGNTKNRIVYFVEYNSSLSSSFVRSPTQTDETTARISGLYPYVSYQFRVVARNDVDESSPSLPSVLVQTLPDRPSLPPSNLQAVADLENRDNSLVVTWEETPVPGVNGPVVEYHVEYRRNNASRSDTWIRVIAANSSLNLSLTSLVVYTTYSLRIRVVNSEGVGPWSKQYIAQTGESVPSDPPKITRVDVLGATSLQVEFIPPAVNYHNGILRGFKVWYWPNEKQLDIPDNRLEWDSFSTQVTTAILNDLEPNTVYNLVMVAYNNAGNSPVSLLMRGTTAEAAPDVVTDVVFAHDIANGQLTVQWQPPKRHNSAITNYLITYTRVGNSVGETVLVGKDTLKVILKGIESDTMYNISIQAKSSAGHGAIWTKSIVFGEGLPGPPTSVRVSIVDNRPTISWAPYADGSGDIVGFKVEYREKSQTEWLPYSGEISLMDNEVVLPADLFHGGAVEYEYRVAARNAEGFGSPTVAQETSGFTSGDEIYDAAWFLPAVASIGGLALVAVIIGIAVCCRRRRISYKVNRANSEMDAIEERFPPASRSTSNGVLPLSPSVRLAALKSSHPESLLSSSDNLSALGPPAYSHNCNPYEQTWIEQHDTSCAESHTCTVSSSDVDKAEAIGNEYSEIPEEPRFATLRRMLALADEASNEGVSSREASTTRATVGGSLSGEDEPSSVSTFV